MSWLYLYMQFLLLQKNPSAFNSWKICRHGTVMIVKISLNGVAHFYSHAVFLFGGGVKKRAVSSVFLFWFCQMELVSSTNLLCQTVGVSQRRVVLSLPISPSLPSAPLAFISYLCLVFFSSSISHPRTNRPPKSQKCSVRCIQYVPYESVFLLLSNKQAKDFIIRVNLSQ